MALLRDLVARERIARAGGMVTEPKDPIFACDTFEDRVLAASERERHRRIAAGEPLVPPYPDEDECERERSSPPADEPVRERKGPRRKRLTPDQRRELCDLYAATDMGLVDLAERFGVGTSTAHRIVTHAGVRKAAA